MTYRRCSGNDSKPGEWYKVFGAFQLMALLEIHDTVDITDFSQLPWAYRHKKEERKQRWAEIESGFISAGPRPEKEEPAVPSDVESAFDWDAGFAFGQTHGESQDTYGARFKFLRLSVATPISQFDNKLPTPHTNLPPRTRISTARAIRRLRSTTSLTRNM